jgi:hypothetical protein
MTPSSLVNRSAPAVGLRLLGPDGVAPPGSLTVPSQLVEVRFTGDSRNYVRVSTLLHIGVPKTGTTAVQAALAGMLTRTGGARGIGHDITMPGTPAAQARAALSVLGQGQGWRKDEAVASATHWPRLVAQVRASSGTVVISSEFLCEAEPPVIRRIADDLGRDGLRVVVTLRPLSRILPSAWQQYLKSGHQLPYPKWLEAVLADPPRRSVTPSFWRRHDHGAVIDRWATEIGADRLSVVALDENDRGLLFRTFDDLLGLPIGSLAEAPADHGNRSMTAAEAELFRRVNVVLRGTDVSWSQYAHLIRYGAVLRAVERYRPDDDAPRLVTPAWALDRAAELGARHAATIEAWRPAGLHIVGDLGRLAKPVAVAEGPGDPPTEIPIEAALEALLGVIARAAAGSPYFPQETVELTDGLPGHESADLQRLPAERLTSRQLAGLITDRARKRLRRQVDGLPGVRNLPGSAGRGGVD